MSTLAEFNAAPDADARRLLAACLDIDSWVQDLVSHRPYRKPGDLQTRAAAAAERVTWNDVAPALARHPRIGEKARGSAADRAASASEQAGVRTDQRDEFARQNAVYEATFGHIFLICAAELSGEQMLQALRDRLGNDPQTERDVVIRELRKIASLRLAKAVT